MSSGTEDEGEWVATVDTVSGKTYYFHTKTNATQWEKPKAWEGRIVMMHGEEIIDLDAEGNIIPLEEDELQERKSIEMKDDDDADEDLYDTEEEEDGVTGSAAAERPSIDLHAESEIILPGGLTMAETSKISAHPATLLNRGIITSGVSLGAGLKPKKSNSSKLTLGTASIHHARGHSRGHSRKSSLTAMLPPPFRGNSSSKLNVMQCWQRSKDTNTGQFYYFNVDTRQTQWERPEGWNSDEEQDGYHKKDHAFLRASQLLLTDDEEMELFEIAEEHKADGPGQAEVFATGGINSSSDDDEEEEEDDEDVKVEVDDDDSSDDWVTANTLRNEEKERESQAMTAPMPEILEDFELKDKELTIDDMDDFPDRWRMHARENAGKYLYQQYAEEEFRKVKKSLMKYSSFEETVSWQARVLKGSLRKSVPKELQKEAHQSFKNIASFMGDRKSGKRPILHVEKLLRQGFRLGDECRDEMYCQLLKQLTNNPKPQSIDKGWQLLSVFTGTFPPSDYLAPYVAYFMYEATTKEKGQIAEIANFALDRFEKTMVAGSRKEVPTQAELTSIIERKPISLKILFKDRTQKKVLVRSQTRCEQVIQMISKELQLDHSENYALYQIQQTKPGWLQQSVAKKKKNKAMLRVEMMEELDQLPVRLCCDAMERILDVASSVEREQKARKSSIGIVFACKTIALSQDAGLGKHGWRLQYAEANEAVIEGYTEINEKQAYDLAAVQVACEHGGNIPSYFTNGLLVNDLDKYLPWEIRQSKSFNKMAAEVKILTTHNAYVKYSKDDGYLEYVRKLRDFSPQFYGCTFFPVTLISRVRQDIHQALTLAIGEKGLMLLTRDTWELEQMYELEQVLSYGFRPESFLFVGGHLLKQRRYNFLTRQSKEMNDLLLAYINIKMMEQELRGQSLSGLSEDNLIFGSFKGFPN